MSSLINKVKDAIHSDKSTEQPEGTHGPHSSRIANAADPRVDSDRDHRAGHSSDLTGTGNYSSGTNYTTDTRNTYGTDGPATSTDGPHKSNVMNKMDPRVDSDRDHSRNMGANPHGTSGTGAYNATDSTRTGGIGGTTGGIGGTAGGIGGTAGGIGGTAGGIGGTTGYSSRDTSLPEGTTGPHSSRMANAVDPRVDSDRDGSRTAGTGTYGQTTVGGGIGGGIGSTTGTSGFSSAGTGAHGPSHTSGLPEGSTGPHNSRVANAADPRVDSDRDGSHKLGNRGAGAGTTNYGSSTGTYGSSTGIHGTQGTSLGGAGGAGGAYGTGPAPDTAGPHKSDMMNKIDPRVDSNLDGSKTVGRDKTFDRSNDLAGKDPTDAAQVPPSVLQKHVPSEIHHEHDEHDHARRHSVSHQEKHRGL